eukprot:15260074-Ditylum_brightwellii.AAC.1
MQTASVPIATPGMAPQPPLGMAPPGMSSVAPPPPLPPGMVPPPPGMVPQTQNGIPGEGDGSSMNASNMAPVTQSSISLEEKSRRWAKLQSKRYSHRKKLSFAAP